MQTSLILIKPDGVQRRLSGRILARFEDKGLQIVGAKLMRIPMETAEQHYAEHKGKPFYPGLDDKLRRDLSHVYLQVEAAFFE